MSEPEQRWIPYYLLSVCIDGHVVEAEAGGMASQIRCGCCNQWTWEEANYCAHCGQPLEGRQ